MAFTNSTQGVWIQTRPGADLFNIKQFRSAIKTKHILVRELMYADDTAFLSHNHQDAQDIITRFTDSAKAFGMKINLNKIKVMYQPPPTSHNTGKDIRIEGQILAQVNTFSYLGSTVAINNRLNAELDL